MRSFLVLTPIRLMTAVVQLRMLKLYCNAGTAKVFMADILFCEYLTPDAHACRILFLLSPSFEYAVFHLLL